jgi:nicotinamide riboside kinase
MLGNDAPFVDDGTRVYKTKDQRDRFHRIARDALTQSRSNYIDLSGSWDERFNRSVAAIEALICQNGLKWPEAA